INEVQSLSLGGTNTGTVSFSFAGVSATTALTVTDEVQTLTLSSTVGNSVWTPVFNGVTATQTLFFAANSSPTAGAVQDSLNTIPALNGNVLVTGNNGGPFTVVFNNALTGQNVNGITAQTAAPGANPPLTGVTVAQTTNGVPLAANTIQNNLN